MIIVNMLFFFNFWLIKWVRVNENLMWVVIGFGV